MEKLKRVPKLRFAEFSNQWESTKLGKVATFLKGKSISKADIVEGGKIECIRYGQLYTDYNEIISDILSKTDLPKDNLVFSQVNDIIIPSSGETHLDIATASCVMKDNVALGGDLNIIRTSNNGIFISYYLNSEKKKDIASLAQGNAVVHLYNNQLKTLLINLPQLPEQQKIASFLSSVDKKIDQLQQKKSLLEQYKKGVMQQLFSQELRFKDGDGNDYPDWEEKVLKNICDIIGGGTPDTNNDDYWNGDIQWFTPTEIKQDYVSKSLRTISEQGLQKSSAKILPIGTILMTTRATIGEVAIAMEECSTNQGFQSIVVHEDIDNIFIFNWIKMNKHELIKKANGSTFLEISKTEIEKLRISIPCKEEQTKIANFLSAIDKKIESVNAQIETTQQFKKGLLQQMFV